MKKLIKLSALLIIVMLSGIKASAQQNNNLVIYSETGQKFWVIINGIKQNTDAQTNVKVTGLIQPTYKAKIIFETKTIPDADQTIYLMDGGNPVTNMEFTYAVTQNKKGEYKVRFRSSAPFASAQSSPDQHTVTYTTGQPSDATTTTSGSYGGGTVTGVTGGTDGGSSSTTTTTTTGTGTVGMNVGVNTTGTGVNMNISVNDGSGSNGVQQTTTTSSTTTTTTTSGTGMNTTVTTSGTGDMGTNMNVTTTGTGMNTAVNNTGTVDANNNMNSSSGTTANYVPGYSGPYGCPYPMSPADFTDAKQSINSKSFDETKLTMAKQIINSHCMLCSQVKEIMLLFSFEQTRLDLAKYSYGRTYDQGNYYKLNDAFTFDSSIDELNKYIGGK